MRGGVGGVFNGSSAARVEWFYGEFDHEYGVIYVRACLEWSKDFSAEGFSHYILLSLHN